MPRKIFGKYPEWYIEALCQGLTIGFSEVLIIIWYSKQSTSAVHLGVMLTLPAAIGAITQALATKNFTHQKNPQRLASFSIAGQILGLATMAFALTLTQFAGFLLFVGQSLYWMGGMTAISPTQDILSKHVPLDEHNRFFCRRAALITVVTLLCNFTTAEFLGSELTASLLVQFIMVAAAARLISLMVINGKSAPLLLRSVNIQDVQPLLSPEESIISIARLSLCMFLFRCTVNISSPFFSAFMLKDMQLSFGTYSLLTAIPLITKTFYMSKWAKLLDQNHKFEGLFLSIFTVGLIPIVWSLNHSLPMISALQVLSGVAWAGFDLISVLMIQHIYPRSVINKLGLFLALGSLGGVLGGVIGGLLFNAGFSYQNLFAISGAGRFATGFVLLWYLRRHQFFRFHKLKLRSGLNTLTPGSPALKTAAKLIVLQGHRSNRRDKAA